jgi:putative transposase
VHSAITSADGQVSAQLRSGRNILLHRYAGDRRSSLLTDHVGALRAAFRITRRERSFALDAIVVLPDHLHALLTLPPGDSDFSARWRRIKGLFSRTVASAHQIQRRPGGEYGLWQRRFWEHTICDDGDFARHVDYIHFNPVKYRLVTRVFDWPHSSFHAYVRRGVLSPDWAGDALEAAHLYGERSDPP